MKIQRETGLVRIECHGQVWFESPGRTEVIFKRLHIEHRVDFNEEKSNIRKGSGSAERDA